MRENMKENFSKMNDRVMDSINKTDLLNIRRSLSSIKDATLVSGVGGSAVVSLFLSKVLSKKNNIVCENVTPRDVLYKNLCGFKNIIACSYSGKNHGVTVAFDNNLNKFLLSRNRIDGVCNLQYSTGDEEHSFISLSSTLIPMTIILLYYVEDGLDIIKEILSSSVSFSFNDSRVYEILSGYESSVATKFIESTLVEAGIGVPIVHDKYDYCHGRSTLSYHEENNLIFFNNGSELDELYRSNIKSYYKDVITIERKYEDDIINDYYFTYLSMLLCKKIAEEKNRDLSVVDHSPLVKKLYHFKGGM